MLSTNQIRAKIGPMLTALHPMYGAAKGTAHEAAIVDRLENARRQLELIYKQLPKEDVFSQGLYNAYSVAVNAYNVAQASPAQIGFLPKKSFADTVQMSIESAKQGLGEAVRAGTKASNSLNALTVAGIALGIIVVAAIMTRKG